jgi:iron-sulfur cluster assembly accessory protein
MNMTTFAVQKVNELASEKQLNNYALRVAVVGGGCSGFTYDLDFSRTEQHGDMVQDFHGLRVYVDPMSYCFLEGTSIDYVESFKFSGFQFKNPNAKSTCGCGSSFTV